MKFDQQIFNKAISMGIKPIQAKLIVAQARAETGNYLSPVFKNLNNAFGYKYIGQKKWPIGKGSAAPGTNGDLGNYAYYANIENSTGELVDWLKRREKEKKFVISNLDTAEKYATALKNSGYYGATLNHYTKLLLSTLPKIILTTLPIVPIVTTVASLPILLLIGAFFLLKNKFGGMK